MSKKKSQNVQESQSNKVIFISNGSYPHLPVGEYELTKAHAQRLVDKKFGTIA